MTFSSIAGSFAATPNPFAKVPIPEECFISGAVTPEALGGGDDLIYEAAIKRAPIPVEELPPEGDQYTRVITQAQRAWDFSEGSPRVTVAIVDSGIDVTHPDLVDNLWINAAERHGRPGVDDDRNGFVDDVHGWDFVLNRPLAIDRSGHGTHCAGNVAAVRNRLGVVGVAPRVKLMGVRFMDNGSGSTVNAIKALVYAAMNGAQVLSNSWSSSRENECVKLALEYAHSKGAFVVASANNQRRNVDLRPSYPGSFPMVIAVGSSNEQDERTDSSNWGRKGVFIFAPGENSLSTDKRGTYSLKTGTSMAAPQVAGAIALGLSFRPGTSRERLLQDLCEGASPALRNSSRCGRMDLGSFMERLSRP